MQSSPRTPYPETFVSPGPLHTKSLWLFGAGLVMLIGAAIPYMTSIRLDAFGLPVEIHSGVFGAEKCTIGGCEPFSTAAFLAGRGDNAIAMVVTYVWRAVAVLAILGTLTAGGLALTNKRAPLAWGQLPVAIFFALIALVVIQFELRVFVYVLERISGTPSGEPWIIPGLSVLLCGGGALVSLRCQSRTPGSTVYSAAGRSG